jgi:hypothetical protein
MTPRPVLARLLACVCRRCTRNEGNKDERRGPHRPLPLSAQPSCLRGNCWQEPRRPPNSEAQGLPTAPAHSRGQERFAPGNAHTSPPPSNVSDSHPLRPPRTHDLTPPSSRHRRRTLLVRLVGTFEDVGCASDPAGRDREAQGLSGPPGKITTRVSRGCKGNRLADVARVDARAPTPCTVEKTCK